MKAQYGKVPGLAAVLVAGCGTSADLMGDAAGDTISDASDDGCPCWGCPDDFLPLYYFVEPYMEDPDPAMDTYVFTTGEPSTMPLTSAFAVKSHSTISSISIGLFLAVKVISCRT